MRLADFIRDNRELIVSEWETFAGTLLTPGPELGPSVLRDHALEILNAVVVDMNTFQSPLQQAEKSKGRDQDGRMGEVGKIHASLRLESGFRLDQLVAEYRALRASVLRLWQEAAQAPDLDGVTRFNEAIDEALTVAANRYVETVQHHRDQFLGVLGHDLRNPLAAIVMGASLLTTAADLGDRSARVAARILNSGKRMERMVGDLLDLTRTTLGAGIPIVRAPLDLAPLCAEVVAELEVAHPEEPLRFAAEGDLHGEWDSDRLAQVVSNLVGNALQHGRKQAPVSLVARGHGDEVVLEVHNEGPPIPREVLSTIFEPMVGHNDDTTSASLGLGLYIAQELVEAHGGKIAVKSTKETGTTFTVRLPRSRRRAAAGALGDRPSTGR